MVPSTAGTPAWMSALAAAGRYFASPGSRSAPGSRPSITNHHATAVMIARASLRTRAPSPAPAKANRPAAILTPSAVRTASAVSRSTGKSLVSATIAVATYDAISVTPAKAVPMTAAATYLPARKWPRRGPGPGDPHRPRRQGPRPPRPRQPARPRLGCPVGLRARCRGRRPLHPPHRRRHRRPRLIRGRGRSAARGRVLHLLALPGRLPPARRRRHRLAGQRLQPGLLLLLVDAALHRPGRPGNAHEPGRSPLVSHRRRRRLAPPRRHRPRDRRRSRRPGRPRPPPSPPGFPPGVPLIPQPWLPGRPL